MLTSYNNVPSPNGYIKFSTGRFTVNRALRQILFATMAMRVRLIPRYSIVYKVGIPLLIEIIFPMTADSQLLELQWGPGLCGELDPRFIVYRP